MIESGTKLEAQLSRNRNEEPDHSIEAAFEGMAAEDVLTIQKLRNSFAKRGENQQWYYAAAGTDVVPVLIAPSGTRHRFVDPMYSADGVAQNTRQKVERSFLGSAHGTTHTEQAKGFQTVLHDRTTIDWDGQSSEAKETVPDRIDTIYSNITSSNPDPRAFQNLRAGGLIVLEGSTDTMHDRFIAHPTAVTSLEEMGVRLVKGEGMEVKQMNPTQGQELITYGYGRKRNFSVYEKTREFTPEEQQDLLINDASLKLYKNLRNVLYQFEANTAPDPERLGDAIIEALGVVEDDLQLFADRIKQEVDPAQQASVRKRFMENVGNKIIQSNLSELFGWIANVEASTNGADIRRHIDDQNREMYVYALGKVLDRAKASLANFAKL